MSTQIARPKIALDVGTVHVWSASLDPPAEQVRSLESLLSTAERERAARLRIDRDRRQFTVRRGLLRSILGRYLDRPGNELVFQYTELGKPSLDPRTWDGSVRFNLSYSFGLALYAVARDVELGVDVERLRTTVPYAAMATRYFAAAECAELERLPVADRERGFFNCWTRKEAYVKALGTGLVTALDSFTVNLTPGVPAELRHGEPGWTLTDLDAPPGYAAAIAVAGAYDRITQGEWRS
jgi:4'-phosphopantetheinyl transferase